MSRVTAAREIAVHAPNTQNVRRQHLVLQAQRQGERRERQALMVVRAGGVEEGVEVEEVGEARGDAQLELGEAGADASIEIALGSLTFLPRFGGSDELGLLDVSDEVLKFAGRGFELRKGDDGSALVLVERVFRLGLVRAEALLLSAPSGEVEQAVQSELKNKARIGYSTVTTLFYFPTLFPLLRHSQSSC